MEEKKSQQTYTYLKKIVPTEYEMHKINMEDTQPNSNMLSSSNTNSTISPSMFQSSLNFFQADVPITILLFYNNKI